VDARARRSLASAALLRAVPPRTEPPVARVRGRWSRHARLARRALGKARARRAAAASSPSCQAPLSAGALSYPPAVTAPSRRPRRAPPERDSGRSWRDPLVAAEFSADNVSSRFAKFSDGVSTSAVPKSLAARLASGYLDTGRNHRDSTGAVRHLGSCSPALTGFREELAGPTISMKSSFGPRGWGMLGLCWLPAEALFR
jgi:hypothetical protein